LITSINAHPLFVPAHATPTLVDELTSPNPDGVFCARVTKLHTLSIPNTKTDKIFADNFFIFFVCLNKLKRLIRIYI